MWKRKRRKKQTQKLEMNIWLCISLLIWQSPGSTSLYHHWYTLMFDALCISIRMQLVFDALCKNGANCTLHTLYTIHHSQCDDDAIDWWAIWCIWPKQPKNVQFKRVTQNANAFWLCSLFCFECARFVFKFVSIQLHFHFFVWNRWQRKKKKLVRAIAQIWNVHCTCTYNNQHHEG